MRIHSVRRRAARANVAAAKAENTLIPRVLVVDDDPAIRETLGFVLDDAGYETQEANDGAAALDVLLSSPDRLVVVLDLVMPGLSGFGLLTRLAFNKHLATKHGFIVCTAAASSPERIGRHFSDLLQRLHIPFIVRPFDIDALVQAVEETAHRLRENAEGDEKASGDRV
jgi:two-component system, LuxR family, response regulator FixJ